MSSLEFLAAPARQAASLAETEHRPWPLPGRSWVQGQTWDDLLFAHWRVDEEALREYIPDEIPIDTHDGSAWLGITPFRVTGLRLRGMVPLPLLSAFLEDGDEVAISAWAPGAEGTMIGFGEVRGRVVPAP